jgi:hypothetical protein
MARLQVLYLPDREIGPDVSERRFGLVLDQLDGPLTDDERTDLDNFSHGIGASGVFATVRTVDCDQDVDEVEWPEEFAQEMREMVDGRIGEHAQAMLAQQQAQQKPPPDTVEGKVARTWGGGGKDPREVLRARHGQVSGQ